MMKRDLSAIDAVCSQLNQMGDLGYSSESKTIFRLMQGLPLKMNSPLLASYILLCKLWENDEGNTSHQLLTADESEDWLTLVIEQLSQPKEDIDPEEILNKKWILQRYHNGSICNVPNHEWLEHKLEKPFECQSWSETKLFLSECLRTERESLYEVLRPMDDRYNEINKQLEEAPFITI